jgi:hypothetical protein
MPVILLLYKMLYPQCNSVFVRNSIVIHNIFLVLFHDSQNTEDNKDRHNNTPGMEDTEEEYNIHNSIFWFIIRKINEKEVGRSKLSNFEVEILYKLWKMILEGEYRDATKYYQGDEPERCDRQVLSYSLCDFLCNF